ncbi:antitoxin [Pseudoclavibacter alba]|uniref:antitoxin n=1 Tax=Pseudoclavibacter albus TaxID=272241 RepID=UPI0008268CDF|nr:antitoxin [Pseudoclavibacter alba]MBN6777213.1 antitoxin [Pseudoclavibacter alba]
MGLMDKANEFLGSEQGEQASDQALQGAADFANERTGGQHGEQIQQAQQFLDDKIGQQGQPGQQQ